MIRLLLAYLVILTACSPKKQPLPPAPVNTATLQQQIAANRQLINTTYATDSLLFLYRQQVQLAKQANDLTTFCNSHQELYNLLSDSVPAVATRHLDSIIQLEDTLRRHTNLHPLLALAYGNRYYHYEQQELNPQVVADCEKYLQYSNPSLDSQYLALVLNAAGIAAAQIGDQQQSVLYLERLLKWVQAHDEPEVIARATINLANSYNNTGRYTEALETARQGLQLKGISAERRAYLQAIQAQVFLEQNNYPQAEQAANIALNLLTTLTDADDYATRMSVLLKVKADVYTAQHQNTAALQACYQSLKQLEQVNPGLKNRDAGKTFLAMARLYRSEEQGDSAMLYCNKALAAVCEQLEGESIRLVPAVTSLYPENTIMEALDEKAGLLEYMYTGRKDTSLLQTALLCVNRSFEVEQQLRSYFIYDNSKYRQAVESRGRSERAIRICLLLEAVGGENKWLQQAFLFAEKSKANVLLDKVNENLLAGNGSDPAFVKARQLQLQLDMLDEELERLPNDSAGKVRKALLQAQKDGYSQLYARYKTGTNEKLNKLYDDFAKQDLNTADFVKRLKGKAEAIAEYFSGDTVLYGFYLHTHTGLVSYIRTPLQPVQESITALLPFLNNANTYNNNPAAYSKLATGLYNRLLQPLLANNNYSCVIAIPDGVVGLLPLAALHVTKSNGAPEFLVNSCYFNYAFSCASLLRQMELPRTGYEYEAAFFAPFMKVSFRGLPVLPQSQKEQAAIAGLGRHIDMVNGHAVKQAFIQEAPHARLLHIATHAYAADSTTPRIEFADSSLSLNTIYSLNLNNQLVVLSACHTGAGNIQQSEGVLSLARGFYYAGARNVINSLWEANDQAAGQVFDNFYRQLEAGDNPGEALHKSQQQYLAQAAPEKRSPYYWASYVCTGDGDYRTGNAKRSLLPWVAGAAALFIVLIVVIVKQQKNRRKRRL